MLQIKVEERHSGNYCGLGTFVLVEQMVKINMVTKYWVLFSKLFVKTCDVMEIQGSVYYALVYKERHEDNVNSGID